MTNTADERREKMIEKARLYLEVRGYFTSRQVWEWMASFALAQLEAEAKKEKS